MCSLVLFSESVSRMSALLESFTGPLALPGRYFTDTWYPRSRNQSSPWPQSGRVHVLALSSSGYETWTVTIGHIHSVESTEGDQRNGLTKRATQDITIYVNCSRDNKIVSFNRVPVGRNRLTDMENTCGKNVAQLTSQAMGPGGTERGH